MRRRARARDAVRRGRRGSRRGQRAFARVAGGGGVVGQRGAAEHGSKPKGERRGNAPGAGGGMGYGRGLLAGRQGKGEGGVVWGVGAELRAELDPCAWVADIAWRVWGARKSAVELSRGAFG